MCIENLQGVTSLQYSRLYERLGEYERERKPSMNTNLMHQGIAFLLYPAFMPRGI